MITTPPDSNGSQSNQFHKTVLAAMHTQTMDMKNNVANEKKWTLTPPVILVPSIYPQGTGMAEWSAATAKDHERKENYWLFLKKGVATPCFCYAKMEGVTKQGPSKNFHTPFLLRIKQLWIGPTEYLLSQVFAGSRMVLRSLQAQGTVSVERDAAAPGRSANVNKEGRRGESRRESFWREQ